MPVLLSKKSLVCLCLLLFILVGCGGGGGGDTITGVARIRIDWAPRSRQSGLSSALSARITLAGAGTGARDIVWIANRPSDTPIGQGVSQVYVAPERASLGEHTLSVAFYARNDAAGDTVGTASAVARITAEGSSEIALTNYVGVASVRVLPGQSVKVGQTKDLLFEARNASDQIVALTPGSAVFVATGTDLEVVDHGSAVLGRRPAVAASVTVRVDGLTSAPQGVAVTSDATLVVSPQTARVPPGASVAITAMVANAPDLSVDFAIEGGSANGTLESLTATSVTFVSPTISGPARTVNITATSRWDPNQRRTIAVEVVPGMLVVTDGGSKVAQPGWTVRINPDVQPRKKWTVLVYMNGANDLETYGVLNMNQMEQVGSTESVNYVVQFKRIAGKFDSSNGDWSDTRRYYVTQDTDIATVHSDLIAQREGIDMGRPSSLQAFIQWGMATFPAERYSLVLWNHGAGWRKAKLPGATRGFSYDDVTGNHIDTIQMPSAMARPDGFKWDAVVMDCSLMQMIEVAYEIRNSAQCIVGSEESPPGEGYPYDTVMRQLAQSPSMTGRDLCMAFANETLVRYGDDSNSTQSVLDASKIAPIAAKLNALGAALQAVKATHGTSISVARALAESYDYAENKDLLDFLDALSADVNGQARVPDAAVQVAVTEARGAIQAAIVLNRNGSQHPRSKGLAGLLTTPSRFLRLDTEQANGFGQRYRFLQLAVDAPDWLDFLANGPS